MSIGFPLRFHEEEEGGYWVQGLPPFENVLSGGKTRAEARAMAAEALTGVLKHMLDAGQRVPRPSAAQGPGIEAIVPAPAVVERLRRHWSNA